MTRPHITKISAASLSAGMHLYASNRTVAAVFSIKGSKTKVAVYTVTPEGKELRGEWNARTQIGVVSDTVPSTHYLHPSRRRAA